MKEIKTKDTGKSVSGIDKSSELSSRMKRGLIRTKDHVQNYADDGQVTPEEYAEYKIKYASDDIAGEIAHDSKETVKKTYDGSKRLVQQIKQKRQSGDSIKQTSKSTGKQTFKTMKKSIKTTGKTTGKTIKTSEATAKTTVKTTKKAVKTAEQTAKAAKKAAEASAKAAKKAAEAARAAAKAAAKTAKVVVKAVVAAAKAIVSAVKALAAAIAEGGWVAVVVILVILLIVIVAMIIGSGFGIFGSMEDAGTGMTVQDAIIEINTEYDISMTEILEDNEYDEIEMHGNRAKWREVLAVYAVKTAGDSENAQEVVTMDAFKSNILRMVFWDMNQIEYRMEVREDTVQTETIDDNGNVIVSETMVERICLVIVESHKTVDEMAERYGFSDSQKEQLRELLSEKNQEIWDSLLSDFPGE